MATKQQKKDKLKLIKEKQKENKNRNKAITKEPKLYQVVHVINDGKENQVKKIKGIRGYALSSLNNIIQDLKNDVIDDENIEFVAKVLYQLSNDPMRIYSYYINENKGTTLSEKKIKVLNESLKKSKYNLNKTERALLKIQMQIVLKNYFESSIYDRYDYGRIRVAFEVAYELIYAGLEERKILLIVLNVKYGDILDNVEIHYIDSDEKYSLNEEIFMYYNWNALNELYDKYSRYKVEYGNFSKESINSLATAENMYNTYKDREEESEIISYKGIAMNYLGVLEEEIKNMVCRKYDFDLRKITFNDAINHVKKGKFPDLSDSKVIEILHQMRIMRNKAAHPGETITLQDIEYIRKQLIDEKILQYIDWNLTHMILNIEWPYKTFCIQSSDIKFY